MATLRLKRLQIDRFRNVAPGTVLVFKDGKNVLLGPNGSGKTTLLRLIAAVAFDDFWSLEDEELDIAYDVELLAMRFRVRLANRRSNGGQGRRIGGGPGTPSDWRLQVSILGTSGKESNVLVGSPLGVKGTAPETQLPVEDPFRERGPISQSLESLRDLADGAVDNLAKSSQSEEEHAAIAQVLKHLSDLLKARGSLIARGGRFDEALGVFAGIVGSPAVLDLPDRRFVYLVREDGVRGGFIPEDLRRAVESLPRVDGGSDITLTHEFLPFLSRVVSLLNARHAKMILRLQEKTEDGKEHFADFEFLFTLDDGTIIRHDLLSWGQKRILSFFYYAAANPDILVVDELVNGLHHEWIAACLKEMEGRQCFLTSQNPLLLDQLVFSSPEDVRGTFIQCRREKKGERRAELHWQPMDEASAESFFRAYSVGIQHVGEILRTKGLW